MTKENYTHIECILDHSGSMNADKKIDEARTAVNNLLEEHKELPGDCSVGITIFDSYIDELYSGPIASVPILTEQNYYARGMTALLDAIGTSVSKLGEKLRQMSENDRPSKVIVAIMTDGLENASREFSRDQIKNMIEQQTNTYSWEFIFMAADLQQAEQAKSIGIQQSGICNYQGDMSQGMRSYSLGITGSRAGRPIDFTDPSGEEE